MKAYPKAIYVHVDHPTKKKFKSQELPEPLSKKLKSVKILYTFTHVIEIKNINEYIDVKNIYEFMVKIVIKSTENIFVILNDVANKLLSHKSEQVTDS
jgi:hypothetical protein